MDAIELLSGYDELLNHPSLGLASILVANSTKCCATGTCDQCPY